MSTAVATVRITEMSPLFRARIAGAFYLLTFVTGGVALFVRSRLGVIALTLWLLAVGVNVQRWNERAAHT